MHTHTQTRPSYKLHQGLLLLLQAPENSCSGFLWGSSLSLNLNTNRKTNHSQGVWLFLCPRWQPAFTDMQRTTDPRSSMTATGVLPSHSKWLWVGPDHMLFLTSMDSSPLGTLVCLWQNPLLPLPQPALPAYCARSPMWVFSQACFGPTWAWNLLLSSFLPASYLGLSLQPCFLGLLNSFKFFCTSLCNAGSSWKHSSLPSIFPGLSQLKTPPPEGLPVFLVWWAGDACSWAPTAALGHGAFHPGCCLHSVLFVSPWSVEFSSWPPPREGTLLPDGDTEVSLLPA